MTTAVRGTRAAARYGRLFLDFVLRRRARAIWFNALLAFGLAAVSGSRPPSVHDEFSYLLSGDTFAHGRLTNPTHPMWRHFETFHVIHQPTYSSKYPPAQGLVLALGARLTGSPAFGVWISCGFMIAALTWMLQAWVTPRWAFWGGVAAAIWITGQHAFEGYWATSSWGGSVAATGGMLILGALRRLARTPAIGSSIALGAGVALLATSRPFEGIFFSLVPFVVTCWLLSGHVRRGHWRHVGVVAGPALLVLVVTGTFVAAHNRAVTGSAMEFPYARYFRTYDSSPTIAWQRVPEQPRYAVPEMAVFYTRGIGYTRPPETWREFRAHLSQASAGIRYYLPVFALPLLFVLPWAIRGRWAVLALASLGTTLVACALTLFFWQPHYIAPAAGAVAILYVNSARFYARAHRRGIKGGRILLGMIFATLLISTLVQLTTDAVSPEKNSWAWNRAAIQRRLAAEGSHFVLVEYGPRHDAGREWVYNEADIDASPVIWARSLGEAEDAAFMKHFANRRGWRLRVDDDMGPHEVVPINR